MSSFKHILDLKLKGGTLILPIYIYKNNGKHLLFVENTSDKKLIIKLAKNGRYVTESTVFNQGFVGFNMDDGNLYGDIDIYYEEKDNKENWDYRTTSIYENMF